MVLLKTTLVLSLFVALAAALPRRPQTHRLNVRDDEANFGLRLLNELEAENGGIRASKNIILGPTGVRTALAMLAAGAAGTTLEEIQLAIGTTSMQSPVRGATDYAQSLNLLAIHQGDFPFKPEYLALLQSKFNADLRKENFHTFVNIYATADINQWISNQTHGNISNFFADYFPILTKMVAANAEYLHGTWQWPILPSSTDKEAWQLSNGETKMVDMMNFFGYLNSAQFDDGQLVEIPFNDNGLNFLAFLPDPAKLATATSISELFGTIPLEVRLKALQGIYTSMAFPKYKPKSPKSPLSGYSIKELLQSQGINSAFMLGSADFSGIDGARDLHLADFLHQVSLQWDETSAQGEAGSGGDLEVPAGIVASEVDDDLGAGGGIMPTPPQISMTLNSSFLFLIRDTNQSPPMTLFAGVMHDPESL